ncbi:ABC transporter ATPase [Catenovulum agarivorans DS-2]|uniref:ABC transporter ATPase n=1 Tax=Catenovulum agarivorans DS-2 TaxID=1328313 RepID=W7Q6J5_9ALTE|nr:ABC transporter ATP-binding protein [Catenovulum agarivorans]EWH08384.1 ABC transporter ATPase [Catenovulum agarivorans DS-2]
MTKLIDAQNLIKKYGKKTVLNGLNFQIGQGEIVGVIGTNGAGKTSLLKSLLGLTPYQGEVTVCGYTPAKQRTQLMSKVSFISDTNTLPHWISVSQLFEYMQTMHPNFDINLARHFLQGSSVTEQLKISEMSKGMVTKLHLALAMAVKSELLVLDEPTLGLDIVHRKAFYQNLLDDYFDKHNTIVVTTHQIEEIEHILTRVIFIDAGTIMADFGIEDIEARFVQLHSTSAIDFTQHSFQPLATLGGVTEKRYLFDGVTADELNQLGNTSTPSLGDLFVAMTQVNKSQNSAKGSQGAAA